MRQLALCFKLEKMRLLSMELSVRRGLYVLWLGAALAACSSGDIDNPDRTGLPGAGGPASTLQCGVGQTACNTACTDVRIDPLNCGQCGASCGTGTCSNGACACPSTLTSCPGGGCVDITNDDANCGVCGRKCAASERCQQNQCVPLAAVCNPPCAAGQICSNAICKCPELTSFCGGACVDPQTTPQHCGACDNACAPGQLCQGGACVCPAGQTACNGQCADLQISPQSCGMCGRACAANEACMAGVCRAPSGADGCSGAATGLAIKEVALYQSIKIPMSTGVTPIAAMQRVAAVIQDRPTLFRVFVTPAAGFVPRQISARVTIKNGAAEDQYFAKQMVTKASTDADSASTFQISVPREKILETTTYSVELVECGGGAAGTPAGARFPATGEAALEARDTGTLKIKVIPLRTNSRSPDTSEASLKVYRDYLEAMYPVNKVEITVGTALDISYPVNWNSVIEQLRSQRQTDRPAAEVYYYGLLQPTETLREYCRRGCTAGVGFVGSATQSQTRVALGLAYADEMSAATMAHEVGHNHGRNHAPCAPGGGIQGVDSRYPHEGAEIGVWGYDSRKKTFFEPTGTTDIMGYCEPKWISDYTYKGITDRSSMTNVQALTIPEPGSIQRYRVLLLDAEGPRWSQPFPAAAEPYGTPEEAEVLDLDRNTLERVTVYRTHIGDTDASTVLIPEPRSSWHAIKTIDAQPHAFSAPVTVPDPR